MNDKEKKAFVARMKKGRAAAKKKGGAKRKTKYKIGSRSVNVPIHSEKVTEWALGFEAGYKKSTS